MRLSMYEINKNKALQYSKNYQVTEASDISYFQCKYWQGRIDKAFKIDNTLAFYFELHNGDFVKVEK
jgi:hypothetical protein